MEINESTDFNTIPAIKRYLELVKMYPSAFFQTKDLGSIKIITDLDIIKKWCLDKKNYKDMPLNSLSCFIGVQTEDSWFFIIRDLVVFPDGEMGGYLRIVNKKQLEGSGGVVVLPYCDGKIYIHRHYRHALRSWLWELPRGFGEIGVLPEDSARNELLEETGFVDAKMEYLGKMIPDSGIMRDIVNIYFAEVDAKIIDNNSNRGSSGVSPMSKSAISEGITSYLWVSPEEFEEMLLKGDILDSFSLVAYQYAKLKRLIYI